MNGRATRCREIRVGLRIAVMAMVLSLLFAAAPWASAAIKIARIRYNPPGADSGTNRHLNHEFIVIRNAGPHRVVLTGWTIVEQQADLVFTFPRFRLSGHDKVRIHSGVGTDSRYDLFWNDNMYHWDNGLDTAILRDRDDDRIDRCHYVNDPEVKQWLGHMAEC